MPFSFNWLDNLLHKEADEESQLAADKFSTNIIDPTAEGNKSRELALSLYETESGALLEANWEPSDYKVFSKTYPSVQDAQSMFSDMKAQLLAITNQILEGESEAAEQASKAFLSSLADMSPEPLNQPSSEPITHTQASAKPYMISILLPAVDKQAKATIQNIFFSDISELMEYQEKLKALQPPASGLPGQGPATGVAPMDDIKGPLLNTPAQPSALEKMIDTRVKETVESSLDTKARAIFEDVHAETVKNLRKLGRSWEEIKDFFNRYLKYDWDDIDIFLEQFMRAEEGDTAPNLGVEKVKQELKDESEEEKAKGAPEGAPPELAIDNVGLPKEALPLWMKVFMLMAHLAGVGGEDPQKAAGDPSKINQVLEWADKEPSLPAKIKTQLPEATTESINQALEYMEQTKREGLPKTADISKWQLYQEFPLDQSAQAQNEGESIVESGKAQDWKIKLGNEHWQLYISPSPAPKESSLDTSASAEYKEFQAGIKGHHGGVTVYYGGTNLMGEPFPVTVNWSAYGSVPVEEAAKFTSTLAEAIEFARSIREPALEGLSKKAELVRDPDLLKVGDKVELVRSVMAKENTIIPVQSSGKIVRVSPYEVVIEGEFGRFTLSKPDCAKLDKKAALVTTSKNKDRWTESGSCKLCGMSVQSHTGSNHEICPEPYFKNNPKKSSDQFQSMPEGHMYEDALSMQEESGYGRPEDKLADDWMAQCRECGLKFWASQGGVQHFREYEGASEQSQSGCPECGADSAFWEDLGNGSEIEASPRAPREAATSWSCTQCPFHTKDSKEAKKHMSPENPETGGHTVIDDDYEGEDLEASLKIKAEKYYLDPTREYDWEADLVDEINNKLGTKGKHWDFTTKEWEIQEDGDKPYVEIKLLGPSSKKAAPQEAPMDATCPLCYQTFSGIGHEAEEAMRKHCYTDHKDSMVSSEASSKCLKCGAESSYLKDGKCPKCRMHTGPKQANHNSLGTVLVHAVSKGNVCIEDTVGNLYWVQASSLAEAATGDAADLCSCDHHKSSHERGFTNQMCNHCDCTKFNQVNLEAAKTSFEAREFISKHVEKHLDEGMKQDQAVAAAYSEAREAGYHIPEVPTKASSNVSEELKVGDEVTHTEYGEGLVTEIRNGIPRVKFPNQEEMGFDVAELSPVASFALSKVAAGERQKIRELKDSLSKATKPTDIKSICDAIEALEGHMDRSKERKTQRKEEKAKKQPEKPTEETSKVEAVKDPDSWQAQKSSDDKIEKQDDKTYLWHKEASTEEDSKKKV